MKLAVTLAGAALLALVAAVWLVSRSPRSAVQSAAPVEVGSASPGPSAARQEPALGEDDPRHAAGAEEAEGEAAAPEAVAVDQAQARGAEVLLRLDEVCDTFLTEAPDAAALDVVLKELLQEARVVADSVEVSEVTGEITGRMELAGGAKATFSIRGERYTLDLMQPREDSTLRYRQVTLITSSEGGAQSLFAKVQFHPDTNKAASLALPDGEAIVGWSLSTKDGVSAASPNLARPGEDGATWLIGNLDGAAPIQDLPGAHGAGGDAAALLVHALAPLKH